MMPATLAGDVAFGMPENASRRYARLGRFPCPVIKRGNRYYVTRAAVMAALEIDPDLPDVPEADPEPAPDPAPAPTLTDAEHGAVERVRGRAPNTSPSPGDLDLIVSAVDRLTRGSS